MIRTIQSTSDNINPLREAWVEDLLYRYSWHEFATCTFRYPQYDDSRALRMFIHWLNGRYFSHAIKVGDAQLHRKQKLDKSGDPVFDLERRFDAELDCEVDVRVPRILESYSGSFRNRWRRHPEIHPVWVLGIEQHRNGGNHMHALIHHRWYADELRRDEGWQTWFNAYGRMRLEPPKSDEDVRGYLSKYVCKGGSIELSPSFTAPSLTTKGVTVGRPSTAKAGPQSPSAG